MKNKVSPLVKFYKKEISSQIKRYTPYHAQHQLTQMAALFSPGLFYYYIFNFKNLKMEYVHHGTRDILGIDPEDFTLKQLLTALVPEELIAMEKKENFVLDFLSNFLEPAQIPFYKVVYFLRIEDTAGRKRTILHQVTTLRVSDTGKVEHALGVHTDVTHLTMAPNNLVSFISLNGGTSYYNLDPDKAIFNPEDSDPTSTFSDLFTKRELEVLDLLAQGHTANQIAEKLIISENTVRTHRKNILSKSECSNITEVVARCMVDGVI